MSWPSSATQYFWYAMKDESDIPPKYRLMDSLPHGLSGNSYSHRTKQDCGSKTGTEVLEIVTKKFKFLRLTCVTFKDTRPRCLLTSVTAQMGIPLFLIWQHQLFILTLKYYAMFAHSNPSPSRFITKLFGQYRLCVSL